MTSTQRVSVRVTRRFSSSPQSIFDAWLDSSTASKWLFVTGREQSKCVEIDARPGGWFYIVERQDREDVDHVGEYLEVVPPRRLVFTLLEEEYSLQFERVIVQLVPFGSGCELDLAHETRPELSNAVRRRWIEMLDRLAAITIESGGGPVRRDATAAFRR
jgi:uncharacterized protein YndB with AHSA1/START domain